MMHDTARDSIREYVRDSMAIHVVAGKPGEPGKPRKPRKPGFPGGLGFSGGHGGIGCAPDTVYIERWHTAYRDRWRTLSHTDTVVVTQRDSIAYPVEVPIEVAKPVPRLYKWCTMGFWLLSLCISLYIFLRIYLHR